MKASIQIVTVSKRVKQLRNFNFFFLCSMQVGGLYDSARTLIIGEIYLTCTLFYYHSLLTCLTIVRFAYRRINPRYSISLCFSDHRSPKYNMSQIPLMYFQRTLTDTAALTNNTVSNHAQARDCLSFTPWTVSFIAC